MRAAWLLMMLCSCARLPPPQPWTQVGPSRVMEILSRHQCGACHSVASTFGAATAGEPGAEPATSAAGSCTSVAAAEASQPFCFVPTLASMERFRARWLRTWLEAPTHVRPGLRESMPQPALTLAEVDALLLGWRAEEESPAPNAPASLARGAAVFEEQRCGQCHQFFGRPSTPSAATARQRALAPDLQHTRARLSRATVERLLLAPAAVNPLSEMPPPHLSGDEARALADYVFFAAVPLEPSGPASAAAPAERSAQQSGALTGERSEGRGRASW